MLTGGWEVYHTDDLSNFPGYPRLPVGELDGRPEHDLSILLWRESKEELGRIDRVASGMRSPFGYAVAVRTYSQYAGIGSPPYGNEKPRGLSDAVLGRLRRLVEIAELGAKAEPGNAYFLLAQAAAYQGLKDVPKRDKALREAAACSKYDAYLDAEADMQEQVGLAIHGYRGPYVRQVERWTAVSADARQQRYLGGWLREGASDEARLGFIRAMGLVYRQSDDPSLVLMAGRCMAYQFQPKGDMKREERERLGIAKVSELDPKLAALVKEGLAVGKRQGENRDPSPFPAGHVTSLAAGVLASFAFVVALAVLAWGMSKLPEKWGLSPTAPLVATGLFGFVDHLFADGMSDSQFLLPLAAGYLALAFLGRYERFLKPALLMGFLLPLLFMLLHLDEVMQRGDGPFEAVSLIFYTVLMVGRWLMGGKWWMSRFKRPLKISLPLLILFGLIAFDGGRALASVLMEPDPYYSYLRNVVIAFVVLVVFVAPSWQRRSYRESGVLWLRSVPGLVCLAWVCFLGLCFWDVWESGRWGDHFQREDKRGAEIRAWAVGATVGYDGPTPEGVADGRVRRNWLGRRA